jgi:peptidoglycan hydrolase-like protein with peptidoglycan-binding domain
MIVRSFLSWFLVALFISVSIVHADAADDLMQALGGSLSTVQAATTTPDISAATTSIEVATPSETDKQAQIAELKSLVQTLIAQLQELLAKKAAETQQALLDAKTKARDEAERRVREKPKHCQLITRTLSRGMKGDDVQCLQFVLERNMILSSENTTGFFGSATEKAVRQFQAELGYIGVQPTIGAKTREEINTLIPLLALIDEDTMSTSTTESNAIVSFGPQLPNGVAAEDFLILDGEKNDYAIRITTSTGGAFIFTISWGDGTKDTGLLRSGVVRALSHTFAAGIYQIETEVRDASTTRKDTFSINVDSIGGGGNLLKIVSPQPAFTFDVITLMPVTLQTLDTRVSGNARLYLLESANAHAATGYVLGEMNVASSTEATEKFPLTDIPPGTYWLQAIASPFQDCTNGTCKEFLPNNLIGPIQITDQTDFSAPSTTPAEAGGVSTTTVQ